MKFQLIVNFYTWRLEHIIYFSKTLIGYEYESGKPVYLEDDEK